MFKIGIMTDSLRIDTKSAIKTAASLGADGFQMYATNGENSPENLTKEKRRELLDFTKSTGWFFRQSAAIWDRASGTRKRTQRSLKNPKGFWSLPKIWNAIL